jgi:hypothetical protein
MRYYLYAFSKLFNYLNYVGREAINVPLNPLSN